MSKPVVIQDVLTPQGNGTLTGGAMAQRLLQSGFSINALRPMVDAGPPALRAQGTLRKDEWIQYDQAIVEVARKRLVGVGDLLTAGMRYPLANALGKTRLEWETVSDMGPAMVSMSGISESENDRVLFELTGMPIPIIHKDFNINLRALAASRQNGDALDTIQAQLSARIVAETVETIFFDGATVLGTNNTLYGLTTQPSRNTGNLTASWVNATGEQIVSDVLAMIDAAVADNMYGPYNLYVNSAVYTHMGDDYKANSDRTIIERVMAIPGISAVRPTKDLSVDEVVLLQMTADVAEMVDGIQPTTVQWETHAGFVVHFKVLTIMVPRFRNDQSGQSGIVHFSV